MPVYEYVLVKLTDEGFEEDITLRSEVLAEDHDEARLKVGARLGAANLDPDDFQVYIRPF